jgi:hypothetical protein
LGKLLSKIEDRNNAAAHELVRPMLVRLLLSQNSSWAELAVSVLSASLDSIPMSEAYARAIVPLLVTLFLDTSASAVHTENVLSCLLHSQQFDLLDSRIARRCVDLIKANASVSSAYVSSILHPAIALLVRILQNSSSAPIVDEVVLQLVARLFATHQSELKFESLSLLLQLLPFQKDVAPVTVHVRQGLFDIVRARKSKPLWAVMRCIVEMTKKLHRLRWAFADNNDTFFPLVMGLVGVEVSLAFDKEQTGAESQMLMVCLELFEMVMQGLQNEEDDECAMLLLPLRAKLNDTCRVGLEFLVEMPSVSQNDIRPLVAARMVSSWAFLDPEAFKEKEVVAAMPAIVFHLPWFLPALSEYWIGQDEILDEFVLKGGIIAVCRLLEIGLVPFARRLVDPTELTTERQVWQTNYLVEPLDCLISCLSILINSGIARKNLGFSGPCDSVMQSLHDAARVLMGKRESEDCTLLIGFVIGSLAQLIRIGAPLADVSLRERIACVVAMYLPAAVANEGLATVSAITDAIENGGDLYKLRAAINDLGVTDLLRAVKCTSPEQSFVVKKLLNILK